MTVKTWNLSDKSTLILYRCQLPSVIVKKTSNTSKEVIIDKVKIPEKFPSGIPFPITYEWPGSWKELKSGLLLLNWELIEEKGKERQTQKSVKLWIHDHGIGEGMLSGSYPDEQNLKVIENLEMMVPKDLPSGDYQLTGIYLICNMGETYPIIISDVTITLIVIFSPSPCSH